MVRAKNLWYFFLLLYVANSAKVLKQVDIFSQGEAGYMCIRIPSIVQGNNPNSFLAFAEGRAVHDGNKNCCVSPVLDYPWCVDKEIVFKRSDDGGNTWSTLVTLAPVVGTTFSSNPTPVLDKKSGQILLLLSECQQNNYNLCDYYMMKTSNDGISWTSTAQKVFQGSEHGLGGPPSAIQLSTGRLLWPNDWSYNHMIYSDDDGATFHFSPGGLAENCSGESQVTELPDKTLIITAREPKRCFGYSSNYGLTWGGINVPPSIPQANCQASMIYASNVNNGVLLWSSPAISPNGNRAQETIFSSEDKGKTWSLAFVVYNGPSAYSSLIQLPGIGNIGIFYERGIETPYEKLTLAFIQM